MLSTLHSLLFALALCHLAAGFRILFPEHDNGADYRQAYERQRWVQNKIDGREEREVFSKTLPAPSASGINTNTRTVPKKAESRGPKVVTQAPIEFTDEEREFEDYWDNDNQQAAVNAAKKTPSACVWAIISCCKPNTSATSGRSQQQVRYACFEAMNCHGAFWDTSPCSQATMQAALQVTAEFYDVKTN